MASTDTPGQVIARVFQINLSDGGVPKLPRLEAQVTEQGLLGDRQRDQVHHGGPDRAVCLYSLEQILALQQEGHPVYPGALGENLTLSGVDWSQMEPGVRLQIGDCLVVEVTAYANPCSNLIPYFLGGKFKQISQKARPGRSRVYARILQPGTVRISDPVVVIFPSPPGE